MSHHVRLKAHDPSPVSDRQLVHYGSIRVGRRGARVVETMCGQVGPGAEIASGVTCWPCIKATNTPATTEAP